MIAEFEQRLANVLGARLPAPFTGQAEVSPGTGPVNQPRLLVGVIQTDAAAPEMGGNRSQVVPGVNDPRRVLRLHCTGRVDIRSPVNLGRAAPVQALDAALYVLGSPDFLDGHALQAAGDPGFLLSEFAVVNSIAPMDPMAQGAAPVGLTFLADGWFWPVGTPGLAGDVISVIQVRGVPLPIEVSPARPDLVAGGPGQSLAITIGANRTLRVTGPASPRPPLPFGSLAFTLVAPGGKPGLGTLSGGAAGAPGVHLVEVLDGQVAVTYTPPAQAVTEELVIAPENGSGGPGIEIGRVTLRVREA